MTNYDGKTQREKDLEIMLRQAYKELLDWYEDQAPYGTEGYDVWLPQIKKLLDS